MIGFEATISGGKGVNVSQVGYPGYATSNWLAASADNSPTTYQYPFSLMAPDLVIYAFGVNEWLGGVAIATFLANLQTAIGLVPAASDVLLLTTVPKTTGPTGTQAAIDSQMWSLADSLDVPVLDLAARWNSRASDPSIYYDNTHPNNAGYYDIASIVFDALITGG